jgi:hypothetical protein
VGETGSGQVLAALTAARNVLFSLNPDPAAERDFVHVDDSVLLNSGARAPAAGNWSDVLQ